MGILGVINSDPDIVTRIDDAVSNCSPRRYYPRYLSSENDIREFLNYELPEILLVNFSDPAIDADKIVSIIKDSKWILDFGIIGIFSGEKNKEESYLRKYKSINILTMMDIHRLRTHLMKSVQIIEDNYQIICQREFARNVLDGTSGSFTIENDIFAVPLYAGMGATILAQRGLINPDHKMQLQLALAELIVNAVEHGNCGITYEDKRAGMTKGFSVVELVAERCKDPAVREKKVTFLWDIQADKTSFVVRDEGKGFDVLAHLAKVTTQDKLSQHGRGIKMASMFSSKLFYNKKGNQVTLVLDHDASVEHDVPTGFSQERVHNCKAGDFVLRENEPSDNLYYIISGKYSVYHKSKKVGVLLPQDIFMGEIAFLLNQPRSASVRADEPGKLVPLSRKALVDIIRNYPHYGIFLSRLLARRLVRANEQNVALREAAEEKQKALNTNNDVTCG